MKPEDFKSPFSWEQRRVLIKDKVWFVPDCLENYKEFTFPGWNHADLFGNDKPVYLEYCSGNGAWIGSKAQAIPDVNWVGIDIKFARVRKIWSKVKNHKLDNLIAICGEGFTVTTHYFPNESVDRIFINFPDPWPKTRHHKHRIIQPAFVEELWRILKRGGTVTFVTDDIDYSIWTIEHFDNSKRFISNYKEPFFTHEQPEYGTSYFEELWRERGRQIRYHQFVKVDL